MATQVICDTCRAPGVIPEGHWWAHCPNVICPSRNKLLLGPVPTGKKYIRVGCRSISYRCVDEDCQLQKCDCCHEEHAIDDVITEIKTGQPIYATRKAPKREEKKDLEREEPPRTEEPAEKSEVATKAVTAASGVWVTCDKCRTVRELPSNNWWVQCACNNVLFAPLRHGQKYIRIKCRVESYRLVASKDVVATCDCCGPSPVVHSIGNVVLETRNGQPVYGACQSTGTFRKQLDKLKAVSKELFSNNKEKGELVASAPPMAEWVEKDGEAVGECYPQIPELDRVRQEKEAVEEALKRKEEELREMESRLEASAAEAARQMASLRVATRELVEEKETVARMRAENREAEGLLGEILADHQRRLLGWEGQVDGLKRAFADEKRENEVLSASILNLTVLLRNTASPNSTAPIQDILLAAQETTSGDPLSLDELVVKYPLVEDRLLPSKEPSQKEEALKRLVSIGVWKEGIVEENNNSEEASVGQKSHLQRLAEAEEEKADEGKKRDTTL